MQALVKGMQVFYFVLLPVFYAQGVIDSKELGYIGALFIVMLIIGAIIVARWLHKLQTKLLLQISFFVSAISTFILFFGALQNNAYILTIAYMLTGLVVGLSMSGVKAVAADVTVKGNRYSSLAKLHMMTDIVRISFPLIVTFSIALGSSSIAIILIVAANVILIFLASGLHNTLHTTNTDIGSLTKIRRNFDFLYILVIEFLDSLSSSQLVVFLPLLFLAKGYSLQSSLILQSFIFTGYLSGRWFVSYLAKKFNGINAVAIAEIGMIIAIIFLLISNNLWMLYFLSYALGVFARGTSPTIEALAFDMLTVDQIKKGTALHIIAGDSGSALGQFAFGLLIAWSGVASPFIISAAIAVLIVLLCILKPNKLRSIKS